MHLISIEEHIDRLLSTTKDTLILSPQVGIDTPILDQAVLNEELILDHKEQILANLETFEPRITPNHISLQQDHKGNYAFVISIGNTQKVIKL
ncbi:GPW/gp25 family protein [Helicobacter bizzozeronii]|uniref:GPW/gp25 family protein n=1 Tax=Helicobacter bizzozeronii TaxID=56877 RepID=UPI000CF0705C|nr:GPW/gp25 family protein [Helicobacter bizzozeronii]